MQVIIRTETGAVCTGYAKNVAYVGAICCCTVIDQMGIPFDVSGEVLEVIR